MLMGRKTILFNRTIAAFGVLQAVNWIDVLGSERACPVVTAISIAGTILRFQIDMPALQSVRQR